MDRQQAIKTLLERGLLPTPENISELSPTQTLAQTTGDTKVEVLETFSKEPGKITVSNFIENFRNRYQMMKKIIMQRADARDAVSIKHAKATKEKVTIIASVLAAAKLPTGTMRFELEDVTETTTAIVTKKSDELIKKASFITVDEVLAFHGTFSKDVFFINEIIWPDIPQKEINKCDEEVYAVFSGDIHVGSDMFLPKEFGNFISWLRGESGDEKQKEIASKVKYIFLAGDLVDGVGIYPGQEKELDILDLKEQFDKVAEELAKIPQDKHIIICPGNHDGVRIAEPQPKFTKHFAAALYDLPNVTSVSNPSTIRIHAVNGYQGCRVLMYHGYSFDYFVNEVEGLRLKGGYDRPDEIIKFLLLRRHLAPAYGSTLAIPSQTDHLLIYNVPDIITTGHIHKAGIANYKGVLTIAASCWQGRTEFQEKVGHHPEPSKVPLLNLKTWKTTMLNFS